MGVISGVVDLDPRSHDDRSSLDVRSRDRRWQIAWSGRIDNRDDLARRFSLPAADRDSQLAADALAASGIEALGAAIGDFVVVAWDAVDRRLWFARDAIGFRPLFYFHERDRVAFSTDLRRLDAGAARGRAINEGYIAEFLAGNIVSAAETRIDGVHRILPGEALGFASQQSEPRRVTLWRPPASVPARRDDAALIDEFRERFARGVSRAIGADTRICVQLSGGLDSTSVAATAKRMTGAAPDAYSIVYPSQPTALDGELLDESAFIDVAVAEIGCRSVRFDPLGEGGLERADFLRAMTAHGDLPDYPVTDALNYAMATRAAADGHRVMLTGLGGDFWLTGSISRLPALLRQRRLRDALRFRRAARRHDTLRASPAQIRAHLLARLTPGWAKSAYRAYSSPRVWPPWLPDQMTARVNLSSRMRRLSARSPQVSDDVLQDSLLTLTSAGLLLARESVFRAANDANLDVRHPMLDREFVEFVMTLPDDLRLRGDETRYILRRALSPLLPALIRDRRTKGDGSTLIGAALSKVLAGRTSIAGHASARGWIDPEHVWPRLAALSVGFRDRVPADGDDELWAVVALETWLEERSAAQ